jgi:hypothetical protein
MLAGCWELQGFAFVGFIWLGLAMPASGVALFLFFVLIQILPHNVWGWWFHSQKGEGVLFVQVNKYTFGVNSVSWAFAETLKSWMKMMRYDLSVRPDSLPLHLNWARKYRWALRRCSLFHRHLFLALWNYRKEQHAWSMKMSILLMTTIWVGSAIR